MSNHMSGHRQRLKDRYSAGSSNLTYDYEALELLLTYSIPRMDVKPAAKALIEKFAALIMCFRRMLLSLKRCRESAETPQF